MALISSLAIFTISSSSAVFFWPLSFPSNSTRNCSSNFQSSGLMNSISALYL
uniref:Uncharacterized protein n=1 Tax=Anguilla anguilla TaxID=7936 RepID=A0A0E9XBA0_ANGAN